MSVEAVEKRDPLRLTAILITVGLHALVFGGLYWQRLGSLNKHTDLSAQNFVDAQLVRFGRPRDLSFLPHKEGRVKDKPADIKIAVKRSGSRFSTASTLMLYFNGSVTRPIFSPPLRDKAAMTLTTSP